MREFIFNSEEEKEEFIGSCCPSMFDIPDFCDYEYSCHECWRKRAKLIVRSDGK